MPVRRRSLLPTHPQDHLKGQARMARAASPGSRFDQTRKPTLSGQLVSCKSIDKLISRIGRAGTRAEKVARALVA